ncbi:YgaP family membrane protein [Histidinibacterium aquaticum]|uniref:DUF2892 domain-containing protein n=1 Tax=Histidinibacterium aquaticum TaxID=2613962 RepID=A0A5J5GPM2_9RHOB|nr:DUF2892 domain-containing protein [Histidinibacterium aquaticum]KAA9009474.1 DUF2892 domain-containing protein [Histidinibacterium aquaticum]
MSRNMGVTDRVLRAAVAALLLFIVFGTAIAVSGLWFWLALAVAAVFALTALVGVCPLYSVFGIRTCPTG